MPITRPAYASEHLNNNLICTIDCETTGLVAGYHDLIQIAIIPLGPDLLPSQLFPNYFHLKIQPKYENYDAEALKITNKLVIDAKINGIDPAASEERFAEWFASLNLPAGKKIVPLGCNYAFDRGFIQDWLGGPQNYEYYFRSDVRDVQLVAAFINDMADWRSDAIPFPKVKLTYLCHCLGVEHTHTHDAVFDALAAAECYRRLLRAGDYYVKNESGNGWRKYAEYCCECAKNQQTPMEPTDFFKLKL